MLIDSLKFSREKQTTRGMLPVAGLGRLRDSLFAAAVHTPELGNVVSPGSSNTVSYVVTGGADALERPVLRLKVSGRLPLQCQRCLQLLDYDLAFDSTLRLVPEARLDAEMSDDPDEPECVAASAEFDLAALIEDEILLALPAYPRHEEADCSGAVNAGFVERDIGKQKVTAFSALEQLSGLKQKSI